MKDNLDRLRPSVDGMVWPALPAGGGARLLALQFQLDRTQWWTGQELEKHQLRQLGLSLRHARETVPFHRERLDAAGFIPDAELTPEMFHALPRMTRKDVQDAGQRLLSSRVPPEHGNLSKGQTSGSTGAPITCYQTDLNQLFWLAYTLRDHLWHQRDFSGKLAAIRSKVDNALLPGWGPAVDMAFVSGPCAVMNIKSDVDAQLSWLQEQDPEYVLTHPSNLQALARRALELGIRLKRLRETRTFGEMLPADLRALCREAWGVPLTDLYSSEEAGYIALQCPEHDHYHVQSENLIAEIVNDKDEPCAAGEIGKVLLTTLNNFVAPLVRYEIGDYAQKGEPCPCGRGLPVIQRIMGRQRNLVTFPDGRRNWPSLPSTRWAAVAPIRQYQLVQHGINDIEARLVVERALTASEQQGLIAVFQELLGYPFRVRISCVDAIERGPGLKYEDFVSYVGLPAEPR